MRRLALALALVLAEPADADLYSWQTIDGRSGTTDDRAAIPPDAAWQKVEAASKAAVAPKPSSDRPRAFSDPRLWLPTPPQPAAPAPTYVAPRPGKTFKAPDQAPT